MTTPEDSGDDQYPDTMRSITECLFDLFDEIDLLLDNDNGDRT